MSLAAIFGGAMFTLAAVVLSTGPIVARGFFAILDVPLLVLGIKELVTLLRR